MALGLLGFMVYDLWCMVYSLGIKVYGLYSLGLMVYGL